MGGNLKQIKNSENCTIYYEFLSFMFSFPSSFQFLVFAFVFLVPASTSRAVPMAWHVPQTAFSVFAAAMKQHLPAYIVVKI